MFLAVSLYHTYRLAAAFAERAPSLGGPWPVPAEERTAIFAGAVPEAPAELRRRAKRGDADIDVSANVEVSTTHE